MKRKILYAIALILSFSLCGCSYEIANGPKINEPEDLIELDSLHALRNIEEAYHETTSGAIHMTYDSGEDSVYTFIIEFDNNAQIKHLEREHHLRVGNRQLTVDQAEYYFVNDEDGFIIYTDTGTLTKYVSETSISDLINVPYDLLTNLTDGLTELTTTYLDGNIHITGSAQYPKIMYLRDFEEDSEVDLGWTVSLDASYDDFLPSNIEFTKDKESIKISYESFNDLELRQLPFEKVEEENE